MNTLRDMTGQYMEVLAMAEDPDLPPQALADTLEGITGGIAAKAENIVHVLLNAVGGVEAKKTEIKRLQNSVRSSENAMERLREYLRFNMEATGITKIECPLFTVSLGKGRDMVCIDNENALPDKYVRTKAIPDKVGILAALKEGVEIEGASLVQSQPPLRIK